MSCSRFRWFSLVILSLASATIVAATEPIALSPQNRHYFFWNGRPTILVTSGEHYGAVLNLDFDYDRYLAALASDGLNLTRTFSGAYREVPASFGITENTLAPMPNRYACPWARSGTPGCWDGGNRFDLTRWDEPYFLRLKRFMAAAQKHGVVVEMNLFCPLYDDALWAASPMNPANNVNGLGSFPRTEALTLKHPRLVEFQVAFTRKFVRELNEFDNLYFEVCNEPYFGGVALDWQHRIADTIAAAEKALPHKHLISLNVANGRKKIDSPYPAVSIFNFHYCVPPDTVEMNYGLNKVIGENETGFRGKDDFLYRSEAWDFLLAGGGLYNNLDYSFTPSHPDGTLLDYRSPGGGSPSLRKQLGILKRFLEGFDFVRMKPDSSTVKSVSAGLSAQSLVEDGKAYAVYLHAPLPEHPKKAAERPRDRVSRALVVTLPAGPYLAEWIDPTTGVVAAREQFKHRGGDKSLRSPAFIDDVALRIVRTPEGRSHVAPPKPAPTKADIPYGPHPHQVLDVYAPPQGAEPFPVVVWFGNLWDPGKHAPIDQFLPKGCAVVAVEMRTMSDAIEEKISPPVSVCLLDGRRAVQFIRLHAAEWKLDPNRIAVGGGSQGTLPALYVGCAGEKADPASSDPVERVSTQVTCVGAWRSQPSIDPKQMQQWVPGVEWGAPAWGCSFAESLKRREELMPTISRWTPEALVGKDSPPIYFEYDWGPTKPDAVKEMDYLVHSPRWGLGFQKMAKQRGATCYLKFPGHPSEKFLDMWDFMVRELKGRVYEQPRPRRVEIPTLNRFPLCCASNRSHG